MTARTSADQPPAWVAPFLAALKDGRGVRAARVAAGVAGSTLYNHRKRDAAFALDWDFAVAPHRIPGDRRVQARRTGSAKVDRFIAKLAETSDVAASADYAGVTRAWVVKRKREDREFARRWYAALAEGYDTLEMEVLAQMRAGDGAAARADGRRIDTVSALRCIAAHRESVARDRGRRTLQDEVTTIATINARIDKMRLNEEAGAAAIAAARAENARRRAGDAASGAGAADAAGQGV